MNTLIKTLRTVGLTAAIAFSLTVAAHAQEVSEEARRACTPDAFRLCSEHIPNIPAITACMKANKSKLSPECRQVMDSGSSKTRLASRKR